MYSLSKALEEVASSTKECEVCGNFDTISPCSICINDKRDKTSICVVSEVADVWALEQTNLYNGRYVVLGGVISGISGISPSDLSIDKLMKLLDDNNTITEVILATPNTIEGQTTAHYLSETIKDKKLKITRPSQGIPYGGELDYLDEGTLRTAFSQRGLFD